MKNISIGKYLFTIFALMVIVVFTVGCVSTPTTISTSTGSSSEQSSTTITPEQEYSGKVTMWSFLNPEGTQGREMALKQIMENFKDQYPNVDVVVEPQQWDLMSAKYLAAYQSGAAPDICFILQENIASAIDAGAIEPLENLFLKDWEESDFKDVDDGFWDYASRDGKHYQITFFKSIIGIAYRTDLMEKYNISVPFKTWDEFIAAAKKLTGIDSETNTQRYGFAMSLSKDKSEPQLGTFALLDTQDSLFKNDGSAKWSTPEAIRAYSLQMDMITKYKVTPEVAVNNTLDDIFADFCAGKYAMVPVGALRFESLQAMTTFSPELMQFMRWPSFDGSEESPSILNGWTVAVSSQSKNKEAAGKFLEFMFNPESDLVWVKVGGQLPMRKSTFEADSEFFNDPLKKYMKVASDGFVNAWSYPTEFAIDGWRVDINEMAQDVIVNKLSVEDALKKAENTFNTRHGR